MIQNIYPKKTKTKKTMIINDNFHLLILIYQLLS